MPEVNHNDKKICYVLTRSHRERAAVGDRDNVTTCAVVSGLQLVNTSLTVVSVPSPPNLTIYWTMVVLDSMPITTVARMGLKRRRRGRSVAIVCDACKASAYASAGRRHFRAMSASMLIVVACDLPPTRLR